MLVPIGNDNSDRLSTPLVTWLLVAVNVIVFVFFQAFGGESGVTYAHATVLQEILSGRDVVTGAETFRDPLSGGVYDVPGLGRTPIPVCFTLITAMFLHGGFAHLAGNMLYLLRGVAAGLSQVLATLVTGGDLLTPVSAAFWPGSPWCAS